MTILKRDELDRHMEAWHMYYVDKVPTVAIAAHFHVSRQSIRNWLTGLGGEERGLDEEMRIVYRAKIQAALGDTEMLCDECDIICETDASGLCASCRGETERNLERNAELELFSDAAFFSNPRNIGRFNRSEVDFIQGVIPVW